jgi:DNA-binding transcriptional LysR family regulator
VPLISPAASWLAVVAKVGSIRKAAAQLNVSPSAVNRQILKLEAEYGAALFERLPKGLRPTAAGSVLVAEIERWQQEHDRAIRALAELRNHVRGHASIGMMESFASDMICRLMIAMREQHVQLSLDVMIGGTGQVIDRLLAGALDLAICYAVPRRPEIQFLTKLPSRPGIVVAHDHLLAGRKSIRVADCAGYGFVFPDASLTVRPLIDKAFRRAGVHPPNVVTTNSIDVMKSLVREQGQLAWLSLFDVHADVIDGTLVHIPISDRHVTGSSLSLIARKHVPLSPVAALVARHLREQLQHLAG